MQLQRAMCPMHIPHAPIIGHRVRIRLCCYFLLGWKASSDEWIPAGSLRLAPHGAETATYTAEADAIEEEEAMRVLPAPPARLRVRVPCQRMVSRLHRWPSHHLDHQRGPDGKGEDGAWYKICGHSAHGHLHCRVCVPLAHTAKYFAKHGVASRRATRSSLGCGLRCQRLGDR